MSSYDFEITKILDSDRSVEIPIKYFKELTKEEKRELAREYSRLKPRIPKYIWVESENEELLVARRIKDINTERRRIDTAYPDGIERISWDKKIYIEKDKEEVEKLINICYIGVKTNQELPEICDFIPAM